MSTSRGTDYCRSARPREAPVATLQGIPTDPQIVERVRGLLKEWNATTVMVSEDSGHVYDMVRPRLPLVLLPPKPLRVRRATP